MSRSPDEHDGQASTAVAVTVLWVFWLVILSCLPHQLDLPPVLPYCELGIATTRSVGLEFHPQAPGRPHRSVSIQRRHRRRVRGYAPSPTEKNVARPEKLPPELPLPEPEPDVELPELEAEPEPEPEPESEPESEPRTCIMAARRCDLCPAGRPAWASAAIEVARSASLVRETIVKKRMSDARKTELRKRILW